MNPYLDHLQPYPFERLNGLKQGIQPPQQLDHIALSIGEPKHPTPAFITEALIAHLHGLSVYPTTRGGEPLRQVIAHWLQRRFQLPDPGLDPERQILPVNGTREALFAFAQAVVDTRQETPAVLMPNPFYQIYEGAALLAGATPVFMNTNAANGYLPDLDAVSPDQWRACQLIYICTPGNPTGAVMDLSYLQRLIHLADEYDFIIASDECYSEIYRDETAPPPGLLQAAATLGRTDYARCVVFHSLSKRSNAPGLRSGFVAGDAQVIQAFLRYRTYHGCAMSLAIQAASAAAWQEEAHVLENRRAYREKFHAVAEILQPVLPVSLPAAGFYLWVKTPLDDTRFAHDLFANEHVTVLPGSFLSRETAAGNPGRNHVRMALVATLEECMEAATRIARFAQTIR